MNHLRSPNCGCCTIIQPHRSSAMANSSAAGLISKVSASTSSARSVGRHLAIVRSCRKVFVPPPWAGGAGSGSLIASSCRLVNAFAGQAVPESASAFSLAWRLRRYRGGRFGESVSLRSGPTGARYWRAGLRVPSAEPRFGCQPLPRRGFAIGWLATGARAWTILKCSESSEGIGSGKA
jgi:hypothetical protein